MYLVQNRTELVVAAATITVVPAGHSLGVPIPSGDNSMAARMIWFRSITPGANMHLSLEKA